METLVIFTEEERHPCYEELGSIEIMPLDAAASVGARTIDLAIIDCGDGVEDGLRLLKALKQIRVDVPVIFITGASSEAAVMGAFKLGARDYFVKPFDTFEFRDAVAKILRFKQDGNSPGFFRDKEEAPALFYLPDELPDRIRRAACFIDEHLVSPHSLEIIAEQACLSKYHFCRLFKRHVGVSPKLYRVYRRVELARQFLARPSQTITMAAFKSGFNDVTEFIRQFKKITGVTPGTYRKSRLVLPPSK